MRAAIKAVLLTFIVICAVMVALLPAGAALADAPDMVHFYTDTGEALFAEVEIVDGMFTVPEEEPTKEGFIFGGWCREDDLTLYQPGKTYQASENIQLYAVWQGVIEPYVKQPLFSVGEKIALWTSVGVLAVLLVFAYYWFGLKERSLKELKNRIISIFKK